MGWDTFVRFCSYSESSSKYVNKEMTYVIVFIYKPLDN